MVASLALWCGHKGLCFFFAFHLLIGSYELFMVLIGLYNTFILCLCITSIKLAYRTMRLSILESMKYLQSNGYF